jgi:16S rRNA (guanine527-N7)-methyltransferase
LTDAPFPTQAVQPTSTVGAGSDAPPPAAAAVFGARLPLAVAYAEWLAVAGTERGLVGPREVGRLWDRHLLNCAALSPLLPVGSVLIDIGSGAGLPGLVVAIARPDVRVVCVDPMLRRIGFLEEVVDDLELGNVEVRRARAEELAARGHGRTPIRADVVTARAVGSLEQLARWAAPILTKDGALVALKGAAATDEVRAAWPMLRRSGYLGSTEIFAVDLSARSSAAGPFDVTRTAEWAAESTGPSPAVVSGEDAGVEIFAVSVPLATVLRVSRAPR